MKESARENPGAVIRRGKTQEDVGVIDFHTHILPGIDDGSKDTDMTEQMLRMEAEQGVGIIVATPHFYANRMSVEKFLERRAGALQKAEEVVERNRGVFDVSIFAGAEVYYFREMGHAAQLPRLTIRPTAINSETAGAAATAAQADSAAKTGAAATAAPTDSAANTGAATAAPADGIAPAGAGADMLLGDTGTLLLEMPFEQWTSGMVRDVEAIIEKQKLTVVLAHIERYIEFQKDRSSWDRILEMPVIPQINAGSFIKKSGFDSGRRGGLLGGLFSSDKKRKFCLNFIASHPDFILGSDCHNLSSRRPNTAAAREEIRSASGEKALARMDATTRRALGL